MKKFVRGAALGAVTALAASSATVVGVAPAHAAPAGDSAAGWLAQELTNGLMVNEQFSFTDYGLSIDAGLSMKATGSNDAAVGQISAALAPEVDSYTTGVDFGSADIYAAASAKALVFAQVAGANPASYGGVDLVARTASRVNADGPIRGRLEDDTTGTDFVNTLGQAFAARGLANAGSPKAGLATGFLLEQQCPSGFFRLSFNADKTAANQSCLEGAAGSAPNVDATALTVLQLSALKNTSPQINASIAKASQWLLTQQTTEGSFGGSPPTTGANSNTTGLAGWALGTQGYCVASGRAGAWLKGLQVTAPGGALASDIGAIAYDKDALAAGQSAGITTATTDQWRRATAQAAPAVAYALASGNSQNFAGPTGYQRAGSTVALSAAVPQGEHSCLTGTGIAGTRDVAAGANGLTTDVTLPDDTGTANYSFATLAGGQAVAVEVLGKQKLRVVAKKRRVSKGNKQKLVIRKLEAGEKVKVKVGKRKIKGTANRFGTFKKRFTVNKKVVKGIKKNKKVKIKGTGEFADIRRGNGKFYIKR